MAKGKTDHPEIRKGSSVRLTEAIARQESTAGRWFNVTLSEGFGGTVSRRPDKGDTVFVTFALCFSTEVGGKQQWVSFETEVPRSLLSVTN